MSNAVGWVFAVGWMVLGAWASLIVARSAWQKREKDKAALFAVLAFWIVLCSWWLVVTT